MNMVTPVAINTIGWKYYLVYACIGGVIPFVVYFFYPETKSRTLEELDIMFKEAPSIRAVVKYSRQERNPYENEDWGSRKESVSMMEKV